MSISTKGIFISFEGIDGCGKSTQVKLLKDKLNSDGKNVKLVREPGGTPISEKIRDILLNPDNNSMSSKTEALLMTASRAQLTKEVIIPHLKSGYFVIADRYADSTLAYQGGGRSLEMKNLLHINKFATYDLEPDITFFIDISPEDALSRSAKDSPDRIESAGLKLQQQVREAYFQLTDQYSSRFTIINGNDTIDGIHSIIWDKTINCLNEKP